jgi:hypothetical protein
MSIIQLYNQDLSPELNTFLAEIKPNVDRYVDAKATAQKERMLIIGQVAEYREQFPQRSADHRLLSSAMQSEWKPEVIKKATAAYKEYKRLKETQVPEYMELAEAANPAQLVTLGRGEGTTLVYEAAKYQQQTGTVPSQAKLEQRLKGNNTASFEKGRTAPLNSENRPTAQVTTPDTPYIAPKVDPDEQEFRRMGVMDPNQRSFLRSLVSNENLEHITSLKAAYTWHKLDEAAVLQYIQQKLAVSSSFEVKLRGLLSENSAEVVDTTATTVHSYDTSGLVSPRWRR